MENPNKLESPDLSLEGVAPSRAALRPILVSWLRNKLGGGDVPSFVPIPGGLAFQLPIINLENGKPFAAKATISILEDGYDLEGIQEKEKTAKPVPAYVLEKREEKAAAEAIHKAAQEENLHILTSWAASGGLQQRRKTAEEIRNEIPEFTTYTPQQVGTYLNKLRKDGKLDFVLNERHKKVWYEVGGPLQPKDTVTVIQK